MKRVDLVGQVFGRLRVLRQCPPQGPMARWICLCICGTEHIARGSHLQSGGIQSCGCLQQESRLAHSTKHGHASSRGKSREYRAWRSMKGRCYNPRVKDFPNYGGRGIVMADAWRDDFPAFLRDMGCCPPGLEIDRIDNDGPYEPGNCRWATHSMQQRNKRNTARLTINGETRCVAEWAERSGLKADTIYARLNRGLDEAHILMPLTKEPVHG